MPCWFPDGDDRPIRSLSEDAEVMSMLCLMPRVLLPSGLSRQLEQSETGVINGTRTRGSGVAAYSGTESDDVTERADIYVGLQLDGVNSYHNISAVNSSIAMQFALKPDLHCLSEDQISFDPEAQSLLPIRGRHLQRGSRLVDFKISLGDGVCVPESLTDNQVACRPPKDKPQRLDDSRCRDSDALTLTVSIGFAEYLCSCVRYATPTDITLIIIIVVCVLLVLLFIIIVFIVIWCCRRRRHRKAAANQNTMSTVNPAYNVSLDDDDDYKDEHGYSTRLPRDTQPETVT